jgi:hypothetical protein
MTGTRVRAARADGIDVWMDRRKGPALESFLGAAEALPAQSSPVDDELLTGLVMAPDGCLLPFAA